MLGVYNHAFQGELSRSERRLIIKEMIIKLVEKQNPEFNISASDGNKWIALFRGKLNYMPDERPINVLFMWNRMRVENNTTGIRTFFDYQQGWFVNDKIYDAILALDGISLQFIDKSEQGQNVVLYKKGK